MYTKKEYNYLKKKYGQYSSWAIWNCDEDKKCHISKQRDTALIDTHCRELHTRYVFLGLNIASPLKEAPWSNFHGGKNDRKLVYACNNNKKLRGAYLTDIFKGIPTTRATQLERKIKGDPKIIQKHVDLFNKEMADIKVTRDTVFIILGVEGSLVSDYFKNHFQKEQKVIGIKDSDRFKNYYHYSCYKKSDEGWVNGLWNKLGINKKFKKPKS